MKDKNTLVIFDFDNTLFRTREFWREYLFPHYEKIGIPKELMEVAFVKATSTKVDYFIQRLFIDELYMAFKNYPKKQLKEIFEKAVYSKLVKKYFYPGSLDIIKKMRKKYNVLLISYGDKNFKTRFFESCGINKYFFPEMDSHSPIQLGNHDCMMSE